MSLRIRIGCDSMRHVAYMPHRTKREARPPGPLLPVVALTRRRPATPLASLTASRGTRSSPRVWRSLWGGRALYARVRRRLDRPWHGQRLGLRQGNLCVESGHCSDDGVGGAWTSLCTPRTSWTTPTCASARSWRSPTRGSLRMRGPLNLSSVSRRGALRAIGEKYTPVLVRRMACPTWRLSRRFRSSSGYSAFSLRRRSGVLRWHSALARRCSTSFSGLSSFSRLGWPKFG